MQQLGFRQEKLGTQEKMIGRSQGEPSNSVKTTSPGLYSEGTSGCLVGWGWWIGLVDGVGEGDCFELKFQPRSLVSFPNVRILNNKFISYISS